MCNFPNELHPGAFMVIRVAEPIIAIKYAETAVTREMNTADQNGVSQLRIRFQCQQAFFDDMSADAVGEQGAEISACLGGTEERLVIQQWQDVIL